MSAAIELRDAFRLHPTPAGGVAALRGVTLEVERGEILLARGPSGAGKTTLLRVLGGLERLSAGRVSVLGVELDRLGGRALAAFRARHLGFVDQHYARSLSPDLSCRDTVALQLALLGAGPAEARLRADELLERVGLDGRGGDLPATLSGGEQQRVAVCAALAHRPGLLLADEPAGELDAESGAAVYRLLGELAREARATAVIVSHDRAAGGIADRTVAIHDGRVVEEHREGGAGGLVVSRGWVRIPDRLRREVGAPRLVEPARRGSELVLRPLDGEAPGPEPLRPARPARERGDVAVLRAVRKAYGGRIVLAGVDRSFAGGSFTAVVGRSGSGKTTLLHLLAGLERPTGGEVEVAGIALGGLSRARLAELRRRHVALVTQEPGLVPYLTAAENVELGLRIRDAATDRAVASLRRLGLDGAVDVRAARLSAGERQRVAIARALAAGVSLLLADEPTARLDGESGRLAARLLARAAAERGVAVVCATHDEAVVELADEVLELESLDRSTSTFRQRGSSGGP